MRPPHFGQDITNTQNNNNNSGGGNEDDESNNRSRQIIKRLTQNGAQPVAHIAGKGIIKVVSRCEDAKENSNLGEFCQRHKTCQTAIVRHNKMSRQVKNFFLSLLNQRLTEINNFKFT